jgi:hypothetical protein
MSFINLIGILLIISGVIHLSTYIKRIIWPTAEGTLEGIDVKIEGTVPTEGVGFFVRPKYIQKIKYSYRGHPYVVEVSDYEIKEEKLLLRVNPDKPYLAYRDNAKPFFPVLAISIGIVLILVSIKIGNNGTN